jgi:hypothetical protein
MGQSLAEAGKQKTACYREESPESGNLVDEEVGMLTRQQQINDNEQEEKSEKQIFER